MARGTHRRERGAAPKETYAIPGVMGEVGSRSWVIVAFQGAELLTSPEAAMGHLSCVAEAHESSTGAMSRVMPITSGKY